MTGHRQRFTTWPTDITALVARVAVGAIFITHGMQKVNTGVAGVAQGFEGLGIPFPHAAAVTAIIVEVGGGLALIIGFALPAAGIALAAFMVGAYAFAHVGETLANGYELVLALGAASLALGFAGGSLAVDRLVPWSGLRTGRVRSS